VVFDVGQVLVQWDSLRLCREQFRDEERARAINAAIFSHDDWQRLDEGVMDEEEANGRFAKRTGLSLEEVRQLILSSKVSLVPIPESIALLDELFHSGVHLYALTNMARGTFEFIRPRQAFWEHFRGIVVSSYLRTLKPRPEIFERLISTYKLTPGETVFLDDNATNVEGARAAGLQAIQFQDAAQARRDLATLVTT